MITKYVELDILQKMLFTAMHLTGIKKLHAALVNPFFYPCLFLSVRIEFNRFNEI